MCVGGEGSWGCVCMCVCGGVINKRTITPVKDVHAKRN